jgi:hypothetical protein
LPSAAAASTNLLRHRLRPPPLRLPRRHPGELRQRVLRQRVLHRPVVSPMS